MYLSTSILKTIAVKVMITSNIVDVVIIFVHSSFFTIFDICMLSSNTREVVNFDNYRCSGKKALY